MHAYVSTFTLRVVDESDFQASYEYRRQPMDIHVCSLYTVKLSVTGIRICPEREVLLWVAGIKSTTAYG